MAETPIATHWIIMVALGAFLYFVDAAVFWIFTLIKVLYDKVIRKN